MTLFYEYKTPFEFKTLLSIYCSNDTNTIVNEINKFISMELLSSPISITDTMEIPSNKFELLSSSTYMKTLIKPLNNTNQNGQATPNTFYSTDSLNLKFWSKFELNIDEE